MSIDSTPRKASARRVQEALAARGLALQVREMPASTRTAADAAAAVGCQVGQIVKSLVFRTRHSQRPVLLLISGANRVDPDKVAQVLGEPVAKADADFVRAHTGFAIGGVPPVGHLQPLPTLMDRDLLQYEVVWAAAGTPNAVFQIPPDPLRDITQATVADIAA